MLFLDVILLIISKNHVTHIIIQIILHISMHPIIPTMTKVFHLIKINK